MLLHKILCPVFAFKKYKIKRLMKKNLPILLLSIFSLLSLAAPLNAQSDFPRHEPYIGYGRASVPGIGITAGFIIGNALGVAVTNAIVEELGGEGVTYTEDISHTGALRMGYNFYPYERWAVGVQGTYERVGDQLTFSNGLVGNKRADVATFMVYSDYKWLNKPMFQMYSGGGLGASFYHFYRVGGTPKISFRSTTFAFQFNPIGMRVGKQIGFFLEMGLGWNGIVNAGISGKF